MDEEAAAQLANLIVLLFKESRKHPFPYRGIRKLLERYPKAYKDLIPDLDWYESNIAGFSSRANTIKSWVRSDIEQALPLISMPFYDKHPEYLPLLTAIMKSPELNDLKYDIEVHEKMRQSLVALLGLYSKETSTNSD